MNTQKKNVIVKKAYCKVCHDAGKSEEEYTNHFVRSELGPKGKVVCPTLLNLECRYCREKGHTVSFCVVLKKNKKEEVRRDFANSRVSEKKPVGRPQKASTNSFGALEQDSDEEEAKPKKPVVEEFPALCRPAAKVVGVKHVAISYAAKVAAMIDAPLVARQTTVQSVVNKKPMFEKNWADWSDSDYEEQEEIDW